MKKKNLSSLSLNKRSVSNLELERFKGGTLNVSCFNCITDKGETICGNPCDQPGTDSNFASCITYDTLKPKL